jgi:hypothetical protein
VAAVRTALDGLGIGYASRSTSRDASTTAPATRSPAASGRRSATPRRPEAQRGRDRAVAPPVPSAHRTTNPKRTDGEAPPRISRRR